MPFTSCVFYAVFDVIVLIALKRAYGHLGIRKMLVGVARSVLFGLAGSVAALVILRVAGPLIPTGEVMKALLLCVVAGIPAVLVTYGTATLMKVPEASTVTTVVNRLLRR